MYSLTRGKEGENSGSWARTGTLALCVVTWPSCFSFSGEGSPVIDNNNEWLHMFLSGRVSMSFKLATKSWHQQTVLDLGDSTQYCT